jgi:hypothetical protein
MAIIEPENREISGDLLKTEKYQHLCTQQLLRELDTSILTHRKSSREIISRKLIKSSESQIYLFMGPAR